MILEKWEASGLLEGLTLENKDAFSTILEDLANLLSARVDNNTYTREEGSKLATFMFVLARKIFDDGKIKSVESLLDFLNLSIKTGAFDSLKDVTYSVIDAEIEFISDVAKEYINIHK